MQKNNMTEIESTSQFHHAVSKCKPSLILIAICGLFFGAAITNSCMGPNRYFDPVEPINTAEFSLKTNIDESQFKDIFYCTYRLHFGKLPKSKRTGYWWKKPKNLYQGREIIEYAGLFAYTDNVMFLYTRRHSQIIGNPIKLSPNDVLKVALAWHSKAVYLVTENYIIQIDALNKDNTLRSIKTAKKLFKFLVEQGVSIDTLKSIESNKFYQSYHGAIYHQYGRPYVACFIDTVSKFE